MRIRSIKPDFWKSEDIAALDWNARLLFIGLWSYVDDNGVGRDNERLIVADLFPLDPNTRESVARVSRGLQRLSEVGLVTRYTVERRPFLHIASWSKHQRIDKPNKARYPDPTRADTTPSRDSSESVASVQRPEYGTEEQGNKGSNILRASDDAPDRFDEFWNTYDKKRDRKKTEQKYRAALNKPGVDEDLIITAAARYVLFQKRDGKHPEFTKDPTTWLNGECWNNELAGSQPHVSRQQQQTDAFFERSMQRAIEADRRAS